MEQIEELPFEPAALKIALIELVKLSSHYATLLNAWDGGERRPFATATKYIERLVEIGVIPNEVLRRRHLTGEAFKTTEEARRGLNEPDTTITVDEGQRQMMVLALAKLSVERPGWLDALEQIALKMDNHTEDGKPDMFTRVRVAHVN